MKRSKGKAWGFLQSMGRAFMYPIALLSVCGMLLGIGSALTDENVIKQIGFLGIPLVNHFFKLLVEIGAFSFTNLPVLFAMAIPIGLLKDKEAKAYGGFSGLIGFLGMHLGTNYFLKVTDGLLSPEQMSMGGQANILGVQTYNTSVLGGIVVGMIVLFLYPKIVKIRIPESLAFYSGPRLVPIIILFIMVLVGLAIPIIWPPFLNGFITVGNWISSSGPIGYFLYSFSEKITIPFGLNHLVTSTFRFTPVGGTAIINGQEYFGTLNMFMAYIQENVVIPLDLAGKMEHGKLMGHYGLVGASLAIYKCARPENRKKIKGLIITGILTVIIGGVSEPIEFLFLFVSPMLYLVHAVLNGIAGMVLPFIGVRMGFTGDLIQFLSFGVLRGTRTGWPIAILFMIFYMILYYFLFKWAIQKFNILTPGREDTIESEESSEKDSIIVSSTGDTGKDMVEALGGKDNIESLDNCVTRLRLILKDISKINEDKIKKAGGIAIMKLDDRALQVIIGTKVYDVRKDMDIYMGESYE